MDGGWGWAGWGPGRADRRERAELREKQTPESGAKRSKPGRRIDPGGEKPAAQKRRRARGRTGGGTEQRRGRQQPRRTERPHWGRRGEAAASCQDWGDHSLTALLPEEHQLEFPQRIPEVSARGHDGAGGATAASAQRPPGPTLLQPAEEKGERKDGHRALSAPAGPGGGARLEGRTALQTSNCRRRRLPAESPSTERGPQLGREGGRSRKKPSGVLWIPKASAVSFSAPGTGTWVGG